MILINHDYMDERYKWLEDLIKRADMPALTPKCDAGNNPLDGAAEKARKYASPHKFCFVNEELTLSQVNSANGATTTILKTPSITEPAKVQVLQVCLALLSNGET
jgi:hypothetical protein